MMPIETHKSAETLARMPFIMRCTLPITRWLIRRLVNDYEHTSSPRVRMHYGLLEGIISIVINLLLGVAKIVLGMLCQSSGLIADGVHSISDMASSIVVIVGFFAASQPPDSEHPFGHARAEYVAALIIAVLIVVAGFSICEYSLVVLWAIYNGETTGGLNIEALGFGVEWVLGGLLAMALIKEGLAVFSAQLAILIGSTALEAEGWHHRSDAISTLLVLGGVIGAYYGYPMVDGMAGIVVGCYVIYTGCMLAWRSISPLLGEHVSHDTIQHMTTLAHQVPQVLSVHDVRVHHYGHFYFTTVHVELSDQHDVHQLHDITVQVEHNILAAYPGECVVHMDPINITHPRFAEISNKLQAWVDANPLLTSFRDLNLQESSEKPSCYVEVMFQAGSDGIAINDACAALEQLMAEWLPQTTIAVNFKSEFSLH